LGDLRPGSITAVTRRCGKPSCHCAKHDDPGHDPQFRLTRRVSGKTVTETFPNPPTLRKAQQRSRRVSPLPKLSPGLWSPLTTRSVDSAPSSSNGVAGPSRKKNGYAIHQEVAREVNQLLGRVFAQRRKGGRTDLEAVESACELLSTKAGAAALSELLQFETPAADQRQLAVPIWPSRPISGNRSQPILTHGRSGAHGPPLLLVLPMSRRSISGGCRTGHRKYGVFSRGARHACSGRPRGSLRSRPASRCSSWPVWR